MIIRKSLRGCLVGLLVLQLSTGLAQTLEYAIPEENTSEEATQVEVLHREDVSPSRGSIERDRSYRMILECSAYQPNDPMQTKANADGLAFDGRPAVPYQTISVDPDVIELGSRVYVPGYGWFLAHDTGSYIRGNRVDLALGTKSECFALGRKEIECIVVPPKDAYKMAW